MKSNKLILIKEGSIKNTINTAWNELHRLLKKEFGIVIQPLSANQIFDYRTTNTGEVYVFADHIIFRMPESANNVNKQIFVAIKGFIKFEESLRKGASTPGIKEYNTKVEIYRINNSTNFRQLNHVYSAHYDSDQINANHPVFHAQITNEMKMFDKITKYFDPNSVPTQSQLGDKIDNVRIPSAHLDIFSVIVQLCADHLLKNRLSRREEEIFTQLQERCNVFLSANNNISTKTTNELPVSLWYDKSGL